LKYFAMVMVRSSARTLQSDW